MRKSKLFAGVMAWAVMMLASTSCGADRDLLTITVIPQVSIARQTGQTVQYIANGTFNRGPDEDITRQVTWGVSLASVATITPGGLATAIATNGCSNTTITASLDGKTATADFRVELVDPCP